MIPKQMKSRLVLSTMLICLMWAGLCIGTQSASANEQEESTGAVVADEAVKPDQPAIAISEDLGDAMVREVSRVRDHIRRKASSLFERKPLGWDWQTINYLYKWALGLPMQIPTFMKMIMEQSRVLGFVGSVLMLTFLVAIFYSVFGRKRIIIRIEKSVEPFRAKLPEVVYPFFLSAVRIVVAVLFPLVLLVIYLFINALIDYQVSWFRLTGRMLGLWVFGALIINCCGKH